MSRVQYFGSSIAILPKEDAETVTAFFEDMKRRGLNDPLLVTSDGAAGIIKAIEVCFPRAARQRCLAHRTSATPKIKSLRGGAYSRRRLQQPDW
jgi:putative transposase